MNHQYQYITTYDLITKYHYKNAYQIPKISKIQLNVSFKNTSLVKNNILKNILSFKFITNNPYTSYNLSKKNNEIVSCQISLKKKSIYFFLEKILFFQPKLFFKQDEKICQKEINNLFQFQIKNIFFFPELKKEFSRFENILPIQVSIYLRKQKKTKEINTLFNSLFFIKNTKLRK